MSLGTASYRSTLVQSARILLSVCVVATSALAGGSGENALLIVDPSSSEALWAANHYKAARNIPDTNVLYMDPGASNYADFVAHNKAALLGEIEARGIADHIDYVIIMPGTNFYVPASGYVTDACAPVNRFAIGGAYSSSFISDEILAGVGSGLPNRFRSTSNLARYFDSNENYFGGELSNAADARSYFISSLLGYTGERGNTMAEILSLIDRSAAADGSFPTGTAYFMHTTDTARSSPRHNAFPNVASSIQALGGLASVLFSVLPLTQHDCIGVMTGWASPDIDGADMTLLPGAFADHLTSFAGRFDTSSQTKMSRWIAKGASATSGAVEEPCNYSGKFPHARLHLYYYQGLSVGEAWLRSMAFFPFENLLYGDPLTRPFSAAPLVDLADAPTGTVSESVLLHPSAVATASGAGVERIEVYVDGVLYRQLEEGQAFSLQTSGLSDGWHDLRVLALDDSAVRNVGRWNGTFEVDNLGRSVAGGVNFASGDQSQAFDFNVSAVGAGLTELRLVQAGRVLAATTNNPGTLRVFGRNLGSGSTQVQVQGLFSDGSKVMGAKLSFQISEAEQAPSGAAPVSFSFERELLVDGVRWIELPASFDDALDSASFTIVNSPAQSTLLGASTGAYRLLSVPANASGVDTLAYRATTPSGISADGTLTLRYKNAATCPAPTNYCTALVNSSGSAAQIGSSGVPSVTQNEFQLMVTGAVPLQSGLFFFGGAQTQNPLGDGFLCVSAGGIGITRLQPATFAGFFGENERAMDFNADEHLIGSGAIEPGTTRYFQYWYRDSTGPSGFNLSDGLAVEFCP